MNRNRVEQIIDYVKGSPITMDYGRWGALNPEQRQCIKDLCKSWLVLDEATNIQTKEIERLNNRLKTSNDTCNYLRNTIDKAIEYMDRRDLEWGSDEHNKMMNILKGSDKE